MSRFHEIPRTTTLADLAKQNENWDRADSDLKNSEQKIDNHEGRISSNESTLVAHGNRISVNEVEITQHESEITDHESRIVEQNHAIAVAEQRLTQVEAGSQDGEVLAARGGYSSLAARLADLDPGIQIREKEWITTEGQYRFSIADVGEYDPNSNNLQVVIGTVLQKKTGAIIQTSTTEFETGEPLPAGLKVHATWYNSNITLLAGHGRAHRKGGGDEIHLSELAGYEEVEKLTNELSIKTEYPLIKDTLGISIHNVDADKATKLKQHGFKYVRYDMKWSVIETVQGIYNFSSYNTIHSTLISAGLIPYYILDYTNTLYGPEKNLSTQQMQDGFVNFALACVNHFKGSGVIWEIYNEPNGSGFWTPQTADTPLQYTAVVNRLYPQIKQLDSGSTVVAPALASNGLAWFEKCCEAGILDNLDAVTIHPYRASNPETLFDEYERFYAVMQIYSNKYIPLWNGEFGYSTVPEWNGIGNKAVTDEPTQAKYLIRTILVNLMSGVHKTIVFKDVDWHTPVPSDVEHYFGIFRGNLSDKPASIALRNVILPILNYRIIGQLPSLKDDYVLKLSNDDGAICYVAWTVGNEHSIKIGSTTVDISGMPSLVWNAEDVEFTTTFSKTIYEEIKKARNAANSTKFELSKFGVGENYSGYMLQNVDLNNFYKTNGTWYVNGSNCTNLPIANAFGALLCFGQRGDEVVQMFIQYRHDRVFTRYKTFDTGWSGWSEKASSSQVTSIASTLTDAGIGTPRKLENVDLNDYFDKNRIAYVEGSSCLNIPSTNAFGALLCFGQSGSEIVQMFVNVRSGEIYIRCRTFDLGWSAWDKKLSAAAISNSGWISHTLLNSATGQVRSKKITISGAEHVTLYLDVKNIPAGAGTFVANIGAYAPTYSFQSHMVCTTDKFNQNKGCVALIEPDGNVRVYTESGWTLSDTANLHLTYIK